MGGHTEHTEHAERADGRTARDVEVRWGGDATVEEVAAIVAAVEATWPRPAVAPPPAEPPRWRFSGRWWSKPVPLRRNRPW